MPTTNQFFWYELMTSDHEAAQTFYSKVVGWKLTPFAAEGHPYTVLEVAGGRGVGGIMPIPPEAADQGMRPTWIGYVHVADIDAAVAKVGANGGKIWRQPDMIPQVGRFAVVADPQGAAFNLLQPEGPEMDALQMGTPGGTDWHELHSTDQQAALAFYKAMFGWSGTGDMDMGQMGRYQFFAMEPAAEGAECGTTCGAMFNDPMAPHPYWLFYFHVDAIDAAIERINASGGKVVHGPQEVPGGMWIVNAQDPQGAFFALVAPKR
jgi:predicted enzyme related to lactoylglutathione lyase